MAKSNLNRLTLAQARAAASEARTDAVKEVKQISRHDGVKYPWIRSRTPVLLAIDDQGNRMRITEDFCEWTWRMGQVDQLIKDAGPTCAKIVIDSGVDFAETKEDLENTNYGVSYWSATVYSRDGFE